MSFKRFAALVLSVLMLLTMLPELLPAAQAAPSTDGCTSPNAPNGKHYWGAGNYKDPWCTTPGGTTYRCRYCKKEVFEQSSPALGHNWSPWETVDEATCTEKGLRTRYCLRCYVDEEREIPALGHSFTKPWTVAIAPTCEDAGQEVNYCVRCNYEWRRPLEAIGHDWDEGKVTKAPTATQDGEMTYTCKNNPSHTKTEVIPATGGNPEEKKPGLKIEWQYDRIVHNGNLIETTDPGILAPDDEAWAVYTITNTGNIPLVVFDQSIKYDGSKVGYASLGIINPGQSIWSSTGNVKISNKLIPGTETEELLGTAYASDYAVGYAPDTYVDQSNRGTELCRTETITRTWKIGKDDGPHPAVHSERTWDDDAGIGKRYEGAQLTIHAKATNVGDCDLFKVKQDSVNGYTYISYPTSAAVYEGLPSIPFFKIAPGESITRDFIANVTADDVEKGVLEFDSSDFMLYYTLNPESVYSSITGNIVNVSIPLTCPDGEEPEEKKPGLKVTWAFDSIKQNGILFDTKEPGVLGPEDSAWAYFSVTNDGNVPLKVYTHCVLGDGSFGDYLYGNMDPGQADEANRGYGHYILKNALTPGTATDELLGTVTVTIWATGCDPETGEELCKSNEITRTWKVGKDSPWPIPEDSMLMGTLAVAPGYESSDPAGYQLGEEIETVLTVKNTGLIDLDTYGVSDPYDSTTFSDGPIAVSEDKSCLRAHVTVTEDDVERGYIEFPMITITWTDPDSEKERTAFAGPLTVTVLKKTGLLLKKGVAFGPEDGDYFKEGEPIQWSLTVTNNSKDSITDVTVEDKGKTVGSYAEIAPGDTKNCTVPVHVVTEYDAKVVGYVLNSATATGTDYRGAVRTWPSNVAKALTKKPTVPGEDPKGDLEGLHPAITITKAEDPHGPLNGSYYEANEAIDYIITIRNVGDTELKDIAVTDSLAGFAPIGTLASLAPGEEKTFTYSYTVKDSDLPFGWVYNSATVTYTFGDNVKGTPKTSDTVQSKVGEVPFPPETPHLDPEKLPADEDYCSLILDILGDTEARYTLHACAEHTEAAIAAEEAALTGDWAAAAELWSAEVESLYETLYEAADSELKAALVSEKAAYDDYVDGLTALSCEAAAKELRVKSAFLCCALHTAPEELESSLAGDYAQSVGGETETESARAFGPLTGSDSEVTETYAGRISYAQKNVLGLMDIEKSYDWDEVFDRGVQLWQSALDSEVNPIYKAADKETRKQIALWRISLDTLSAAEKPFLTLLYEGNNNAITETQMNLYKDAAFVTSYLK